MTRAPLLELEHDEGVARIVRDADDGTYRLSGSDDPPAGSGMTEGRFTFVGLRRSWVYGGFLPAGASRVHARNQHGAWSEGVAGNGVWLAVTRAMPFAVRFEDARASIVPLPLHALEREPAPDATAPCTACGAATWEVALLAADDERAVVCRRCGHRVAMGVWYGGAGSEMDPQPPADWLSRRMDSMRHVFAAARFPVYGLARWDGERSWRGHGLTLGRVSHVELGFGGQPGVVVDSSHEGHREGHERELERALMGLARQQLEWRDLSPAALTVAIEHERLRAGERVGAVVMHELAIPVDGRPRTFLAGRCGDGWAAIAILDDVTVLIAAEGVPVERVALARVADAEPFLAG